MMIDSKLERLPSGIRVVTAPMPHEERFIAEEGERFAALVRAVQGPDLGALPFSAWLERRIVDRRSADGARRRRSPARRTWT